MYHPNSKNILDHVAGYMYILSRVPTSGHQLQKMKPPLGTTMCLFFSFSFFIKYILLKCKGKHNYTDTHMVINQTQIRHFNTILIANI